MNRSVKGTDVFCFTDTCMKHEIDERAPEHHEELRNNDSTTKNSNHTTKTTSTNNVDITITIIIIITTIRIAISIITILTITIIMIILRVGPEHRDELQAGGAHHLGGALLRSVFIISNRRISN